MSESERMVCLKYATSTSFIIIPCICVCAYRHIYVDIHTHKHSGVYTQTIFSESQGRREGESHKINHLILLPFHFIGNTNCKLLPIILTLNF